MLKTKLLAFVLLIGSTSQAQVMYEWGKSFGATGSDYSAGVTSDASGNVYSTGYFYGTVDFDPGAGTQNLTSVGSADIYISKFDAAGNFVWAKSMGGSTDDMSYGIAMDASGNVYTTGTFQGTVDFDPGAGTENLVSAGSLEVFISKLDAAGNFIWAKSISGASAERGQGIALDATGNVVVTGCFLGTPDFNPGAGIFNLTSAGGYDIFVVKLTPAGSFIWARNMGGTIGDYGNSIAIDASGNIYTTGTFTATADFDPGAGMQNLVSAGFEDNFVSKLDASGNFVWAKSIGNSSPDNSYAIAVDAAGNAYTTGVIGGTLDLDPGTGTANITSAGSLDVYVTKFDASGNYVWAKSLGGAGAEIAYSVAVDAAGNVYTTGYFQGTADFDPNAGTQNLVAAGTEDIFISKLDASGNFVWAERMGGTDAEYGASIAVNDAGKVYLTGYIMGSADLDPGTGTHNVTTLGSTDIFVAKYDMTGTLPLSLLQFQASNNGSTVQLQWQTSQEENTASFSIERSADGKNFSAIGSVAAANTTFKNNYAFIDEQPVAGTGFYRLKMIDIDGKFTYSRIVSVRRDNNTASLQISPNPAINILYVQATGNEPVTVQITDVNGRVLQQQRVTLNGNTSFSVNVQQLLPGNYYLLVKGKQLKLAQAFLKK